MRHFFSIGVWNWNGSNFVFLPFYIMPKTKRAYAFVVGNTLGECFWWSNAPLAIYAIHGEFGFVVQFSNAPAGAWGAPAGARGFSETPPLFVFVSARPRPRPRLLFGRGVGREKSRRGFFRSEAEGKL